MLPRSPALLIDADIICYQSCAAVEKEIQWDDDTFTIHSTLEDAKGVFYEFLFDLTEQAETDDVVFAFSGDGNWRKDLWSGYKEHRKGQRKPLAYKALRAYIEEKYDSVSYPQLEADDTIGILATRKKHYIIWSPDKDLKQIPGKHLVDDEIVTITKEEGDAFHMFQTLCGDPSDGYKGCPGVGPKKAEGVTDWADIVALFEKAGLNEDEALLNAQLAKILRADDYVNEEVTLWEPRA